ncbi:MAG: hotdog fold thioesterase [Aeromonas sp.]
MSQPPIWRKATDLAAMNAHSANTALAQLGIVFSAVGDDWLEATMPVDSRTHQPYGFLHGGASALLAESVGSMAANLAVDDAHVCMGLEINANHLRAKREGRVTARASAVHLGASTSVWQIDLRDEAGALICTSRLTMAVRRAH